MTTSRSFVVAARDLHSASSAFERARRLARAGDRIILVHAQRQSLLQLLGEGELRHAIPDAAFAGGDANVWLDELAQSFAFDPSVEIETAVLEGRPGTVISDYARQIDASAIVVAAHREGITRAMVLGSTALRILRFAPCPVVVARDRNVTDYQSAVIAVDLDPAAARVIAATQNLLPEAEPTLLHVYRLPGEGQMRLRGLTEQELVPLRERARAEAEGEMARLRTQIPLAKVSLDYGFAGSAILEFVSRQHSNVLVISQHRGSPLEERTLGSVTQFLLYYCPCDLILVP